VRTTIPNKIEGYQNTKSLRSGITIGDNVGLWVVDDENSSTTLCRQCGGVTFDQFQHILLVLLTL